MNILVVYCHPCSDSFTFSVKEELIRGLKDGGHEFEISDLYAMNFSETFTEQEYLREAFYRADMPISEDVIAEQEKINRADGVVFVYPVFWTEAPAKLVGWFQRVMTYGFAYGENPSMKKLEKAIFLVTMGGSLDDEVRREQVSAMKAVMLGDRIHNRADKSEMIVFDSMTRGYGNDETREENSKNFLRQAYEIGRGISTHAPHAGCNA